MAILEATLTSEYVGQLIINRWHYIATGDPAPVTNSFGLLSAMGWLLPGASAVTFATGTVAKQVQNCLHSDLAFRAIYVRDLYDPTDFIETAFPSGVVGLAGGEAASPVLAYGLNSNRVRTDIRRGQKRFSGVTETAMNSGGLLTGAILTELDTLAVKMGDVLSYTTGGASLSLTPAVLQYERYETDSGSFAYRKYATESAQLTHAAVGVSWVVKDRVRTQTSRQIGRGA